jgi:ribosome-associated translation inhibitor RaiA
MTSLPHGFQPPRDFRIAVRSPAAPLSPELRSTAENRVRRAVQRFARRIRQISIWLDDVNGPRGGIDRTCRIQVHLIPAGVATVEARGPSVYAAVALAADRVKNAVNRTLKRRRTKARFPKARRRGERDRAAHETPSPDTLPLN